MKLKSEHGRVPRLSPLTVAVTVALASHHSAWALPQGEQVVAGQVNVGRPAAGSMLMQQGSPAAIVNWRSFSIDPGEAVRIRQPDASSVMLNRVIGNDASRIFGQLSANGRVFLVNPNGVLFGAGASVDVGSIVASTLGIGDADFLAGRYRFAGAGGSVANQGTITAAERGTVALLGGSVRNDGTINAKLGTVALGAGLGMTLDLAGDGLSNLVVTQGALDAQVANGGAIVADGGLVTLTAHALNGLVGTAVNQSGVVRARSLVEREGRIVLDGGEGGTTLVSGSLDGTGEGEGTRGGRIEVLGRHVGVIGLAVVDASGPAGGGAVLVGGDFQGRAAEVRSAAATFVGSEATLRADATTAGEGGRVIVWSTEATRAYGTLSARGGPHGGNGGLVETSGHYLDTEGARVSAGAPAGNAGQWLLDPTNMVIVSSATGGSTSNAGAPPEFGPVLVAPSNVTDTDISAALNSGTNVSVSVQTADLANDTGRGDLSMNGDANIEYAGAAPRTLTLSAHGNILIGSGARIEAADGAGALSLNLNAGLTPGSGRGSIVIDEATITTNGGAVRMYGQSDPANGFAAGTFLAATGSTSIFLPAVWLTGTTINTGGGLISVSGVVDTATPGVVLDNGAVLLSGTTFNTGAGSVSIRGVGDIGAAGVLLDGARITTTSGVITMFGQGGSGEAGFVGSPGTAGSPGGPGSAGQAGGSGVLVLGGTSVQSTSGGLTLTGLGGSGGAGGTGGVGGPHLLDPFPVSDAQPGGIGGAGGSGGEGVTIGSPGASTAISATLAGADVVIHGTGGKGGNGGSGGQGGVFVLNGPTGASGGAGGAGQAGGSGVAVLRSASVQSTPGALTLTGFGGAGGAGGNGGAGGRGDDTGQAGNTAGAGGLGGSGGSGGSGGDGVTIGSPSTLPPVSDTLDGTVISTLGIGGNGADGGSGGSGGVGGGTGGGPSGQPVSGRGGVGGSGGPGGFPGFGGSGVRVTSASIVARGPLLEMIGDGASTGSPGAGGPGGAGGSALGGPGGQGGDGGESSSLSGGADGVDVVAGSVLRAPAGDIVLRGTSGTGAAATRPGFGGPGGSSGVDGAPGATPPAASAQLGGDGMRLVSATLEAANVLLTGIAQEATAPSFAQRGVTGIAAGSMTVSASQGVDISGIGSAGNGVDLGFGARVTTGSDSLRITGQTSAALAGLNVGPGTLGGDAQTSDIILRASSGAAADSISLYSVGDGLAVGSLRTSGHLVLTPGGLSSDGRTPSATDTVPINVGTLRAGNFELDALDLSAIRAPTQAVVIGSDTHAGAITVATALAPLPYDLTLQNEGLGSEGINLQGGLSAGSPTAPHTVALVTAGPLTSSGRIAADALKVRAGPQFDVSLRDASNAVNTLDVDPPASFFFLNSGPVKLAPVSASGFSTATNTVATPSPVSNWASLGNFTVQTLSGSITLNQNISTQNPNSTITLAAASIFDNASHGTLTPGPGGHWRIWAGTYEGENRGGLAPTTPQPNFYGCVFGAPACASGVSLPAAGNRFIYAKQPDLVVTADDKTRKYGDPNPPLTPTVTGVVPNSGDVATDVVDVALSTSAQPSSPVRGYPINVSATSPVGYTVTPVAGTLTVERAPLTIIANNQTRPEGTGNPPLTATFVGLVAGDTPEVAQPAGFALATRGNVGSAAGTYQIEIEPTPLVLANYVVTPVPGILTVVRRPDPTWLPLPPPEIYSAICTASGTPELPQATQASDFLSLEWSRVRRQPNLRQCTDVEQRNGCSDF